MHDPPEANVPHPQQPEVPHPPAFVRGGLIPPGYEAVQLSIVTSFLLRGHIADIHSSFPCMGTCLVQCHSQEVHTTSATGIFNSPFVVISDLNYNGIPAITLRF